MVAVLGRRAWIILLILGLFELTFGLTLLIAGSAAVPNVAAEIGAAPRDPTATSTGEAAFTDYLARGWGQANIQYGIAAAAIALFPFRRRERWSWYVLWLIPVTLIVTVVRNGVLGVTSVVIIDFSEALIAAAALLLAYPTIFRNTPGGRKE